MNMNINVIELSVLLTSKQKDWYFLCLYVVVSRNPVA